VTHCPICFASVAKERLTAHVLWHRTLTNQPPKED
jgi:hypothetical protein